MTDRPKAPGGLTERSRRLWREVTADYDLSPAELELLRVACEVLDRGDTAAALVKSEGVVVADRYGNPKEHPAVAVEVKQRALFAALVRQLGVKLTTDTVSAATRERAQRAANVRWGIEKGAGRGGAA